MMRSPAASMRRFGAVTSIALAALLAPLIAGCAGGAGKGGFKMPPVPVEVSNVAAQAVTDRFHAVGTIDANETVKMVTEIGAIARELPFAEGQSITEGALIAHLEDNDLKADAARAEALRDQARTNRQRVAQLFEQRAASQQELDDAASALKVAEANDVLARTRAAKAIIRSPLSGVVGRRLVSPGQYLAVGQPITDVASVDVMKIAFASPERYVAQLQRGASVTISTTAYPGRTFDGMISVVDPMIDPVSHTVQIVARIPNRGRLLKPGMSADVNATLGRRANALVVPDEAIFAEGDQNFVYIVKPDSSVMRQAVVIGTRDSTQAEITQGLKPGDRVVRAGYQKLFDGAKVMPMPAGGPGR
ncbi:MAG: efflux RND transporter periplasmic adaptor subunit [Candidatus Eisenbacteria bacterium]|uniref:Efflux RND transporter periplasmic adaptor subunit n=1 Tax=Eiseniibacteriota bacterium TaxID=2212470 RepID=A0A9D6L9X7_UNCEI|nr:efflux RND transporter periplasmic adaptor subunit [Candidatus Eisenbacteria bacterium]MBI3539597.1 efflux RND transporter periplasmic adaptor subunit [Candidatus Eisenbacteria bacterium]